MKIKPTWQTGVVVYLIYNAIIFSFWVAVGADYTKLTGSNVIFKTLVLPFTVGALFLAAAVTWLGWWQPVMSERRKARPAWAMWLILAVMAGFIFANAQVTNWSAITGMHLLMLIAIGVLVGFNEEVLTRGILVIGWRGSTNNEIWVWFFATLLFGLLHLPNGFFGAGFVASSVQVVFAFLAGCGLYLLRRLSGTLLLPIIMHGAWDFASFCHGASGGGASALILPFQFGTYLLSIVLVLVVLRMESRAVE